MSEKEYDSGDLVGHYECIADQCSGKKECGSSDAMALYEHFDKDETLWYDAYCYSCCQSFSKKEVEDSSVGDELGIGDGSNTVEGKPKKLGKPKVKAEPLTKEQVKAHIKRTGYVSHGYRGISDETNRYFGHTTRLDSDGNVMARYYPETIGKDITGYKCRNHPKDFRYGKLGLTGLTCDLSGQIKNRKGGGKYLIIVGGEEDKAAAHQMLWENQVARGQQDFEPVTVVSPTTGEGSAFKQVAAQYDWIDTFEIIVLGMDNDEAGDKAVQGLIEVLPEDKVKVATWSGKDPNKMLLDGKHKQFLRDFYGAKDVVDCGIKSSADSVGDVAEFLLAPKIPLPEHLSKLQENMRGGIRSSGEIVNIIADTSVGKTFFSDTLLLYWFFNSPLKPTIISLERSAGELMIDMYSLYLKYNLMYVKDGQEALDYLNTPEVKEKTNEVVYNEFGEPRFHLIDEKGSSIKTLQKTVDRAIKQFGSKMIVFDPLTDYLRSLGNEEQEAFMMWEKYLKKEGVVFINILHTRKPMPDKDGKLRKVTEYDALGSGTFVQSADINIVLNRDKMAEDPISRNTTIVDMPKRRGGTTGHAQDLVYDADTRQQYDSEYYLNNMLNNSKVPEKV